MIHANESIPIIIWSPYTLTPQYDTRTKYSVSNQKRFQCVRMCHLHGCQSHSLAQGISDRRLPWWLTELRRAFHFWSLKLVLAQRSDPVPKRKQPAPSPRYEPFRLIVTGSLFRDTGPGYRPRILRSIRADLMQRDFDRSRCRLITRIDPRDKSHRRTLLDTALMPPSAVPEFDI